MNSPYFENFLQKMDIFPPQISPYKMQIGTELKKSDFVGTKNIFKFNLLFFKFF
jgi:hypothetical protein